MSEFGRLSKLARVTSVVGLILTIGPQIGGRMAEVDAAAAFDRLKALQGTWEGPEKNGQRATTSFELTGRRHRVDGTLQ